MYKSKEKKGVAFYISSSNQDLLNKVNHIMAEQGVLGLKDPAGRYHYIIDGSKGAPYAARRLGEVASFIAKDDEKTRTAKELDAEFYVDAVLSCYNFDRSLKGFIFLRYMMISLILDPSLRQPLSKTLYPLCAEFFSVTINQVERNLRYCLHRLKEREQEKNTCIKKTNLVLSEKNIFISDNKYRVLMEDVAVYSNADAIKILERETRKLIKLDQKKAINNDSLNTKN